MIPDLKLKEILTRLLVRSMNDEVMWEVDFRGPGTCYRVRLPNSTLRVAFISPPSDPDTYRVDILNSQGELVIDKSVGVDTETLEGVEWLELLRELYLDAYRYVTGWDKVLSEIEDIVDAEGVVGATSEENELF